MPEHRQCADAVLKFIVALELSLRIIFSSLVAQEGEERQAVLKSKFLKFQGVQRNAMFIWPSLWSAGDFRELNNCLSPSALFWTIYLREILQVSKVMITLSLI